MIKIIVIIFLTFLLIVSCMNEILIIPENPEILIIPETSEIYVKPAETRYSNHIITSEIQAPLIFNTNRNLIQEDLKKGVVHYANTAMPGQIGNCFLIGHSSKPPQNAKGNFDTVFAPIVNLKVNDLITIYYQNIKYEYNVSEVIIVESTQIEVLNPTSEPTLTLMTCYPLGTSQKRLIVKAI